MNEMNPAKLIEQEMEKSGVSRESAIEMALLGFEAALRAEGPSEKDLNIKLGELLIREGEKRSPMMVDYMTSRYRKEMPGWIKINDEALEQGQDPATAMSISEKISMVSAADHIKLVAAFKAGKAIEEIVTLSFDLDDEKSPEEKRAEVLKMFGDVK